MNWLNQDIKSSLMSLLKFTESTPANLEVRLEALRDKILIEMGEFGETRFPRVMRRVRFAADAQGLWFARGDVMAVLSELYGETEARKKLDLLSKEFAGMLPAGLITRPSAFKS